MKRGLGIIFILIFNAYPFTFPGLPTLIKFYQANKALLVAKAKSTASTSGTATTKADADAQEELLKGNVKGFFKNPSTWTAGTAATGSTLLTNYFMKTTTCARFIGRFPQPRHRYLKGTPEFLVSVMIGIITFQAMHTPAELIKDELLEEPQKEKGEEETKKGI